MKIAPCTSTPHHHIQISIPHRIIHTQTRRQHNLHILLRIQLSQRVHGRFLARKGELLQKQPRTEHARNDGEKRQPNQYDTFGPTPEAPVRKRPTKRYAARSQHNIANVEPAQPTGQREGLGGDSAFLMQTSFSNANRTPNHHHQRDGRCPDRRKRRCEQH